MTKKTPPNAEEFEQKQDDLAALSPSSVYIEASLIDLVAPPTERPESKLPQRIKHARTSLVLSVEALSRLTREYDYGGSGLSPTSISRYESGDALPGLREFRLIAEALGVPVEWMLYGTVKVQTPEFQGEEVRLLYALRAYVQATKNAEAVQNPAGMEWLDKYDRMQKLSKARKPPQKDNPTFPVEKNAN